MTTSFTMPRQYLSSTLILVESEKVPEGFVRNVATERMKNRLQTVKQEVMSRTRLETVIRELNPYASLSMDSLTETVGRMRAAIDVTVKGNDAFSIEYVHTDPHIAQKVANRLTQLFIDEAVQARKQQVGEAYQFIESELEDARRQLEQREEAVRRYKEEHMGTLPEQMTANLSTLQRLQLEQQAVSESLRAAMDRLVLLETAPPDKRASMDPKSQVSELRSQLASLRVRYTDEHPDVRALRSRIASLEKALAEGGASDTGSGQAQLEQARLEVRNLKTRREDLDKRIALFQARVEQVPRTEQHIVTLTRDFQKLNEHYLALLNKKLDAQMAAKMEQRWKGEQFRVLDPANLPDRPFYPNHLLYLLAGILAGLAAGLGIAVIADFLDHSIRNVRELELALPYPVLAAIPFIMPFREAARRSQPQRSEPRARGSGSGANERAGVTYLRLRERNRSRESR